MRYSEIFEALKPDIDSRIAASIARVRVTSVSTGTIGTVDVTTVQTMINASIATHEAAANPHPIYLTQAEGDALYVPLSRTVTGTGALGGGGALSANQTISLNTPGTLTVTSTNSSATNHTHAITASANVSAGVESLLKSTTAGGLTLATLTTTGAIVGGSTLTTTGAISGAASTATANILGYATIGYVGHTSYAGFAATGFANSTDYALIQSIINGDLFLNAPTGRTGYIRINNTTILSWANAGLTWADTKYAASSGYVSGWAGSGWRIDQNLSYTSESFAEFDNLSIRGTMQVYELVINQIRATNGSLLVSSSGKLASVSGSTWVMEDPEGSGYATFAVNDLVIIQRIDLDSSTIIKRIVRRVTAVTGTSITVTAASGGPVDAGSPAAGDAVVRFGNSTNTARQGVILLTSEMSNSPYIDIINGVSAWSEWGGSSKTKARLGLLTGITSVSGEYGIIAGSGFAATNAYIRMSSSGVFVNNSGATWSTSGTNFLTIDNTDGITIIANTAYTSSRAFKFSDGSSEIGGFYMYTQVSGRGISLTTQPTTKASLVEVRSESNTSYSTQLLLEAKQSTNLSRISLDISSGGTRSITYTTTTHSFVSSAETGSVDIKLGGLVASIDTTDYTSTASATAARLGTITISTVPYAILILEANTGEPFFINASTSVMNYGYNGLTSFSMNTSGNITFANNISVTGSATFNYITNPLYVHTTDVSIATNYSMFTGTYGTSASISLVATSWGNSGHVAFNAYLYDPSIAYTASGAWKYWATQYTGNVTAPGLISFDGNGNYFRFSIGETGLAYDANITTWTTSVYITSTSLGIGVSPTYNLHVVGKAYINQSSTTLADATITLNQADLSEEFINFTTTVGTGNAIDTAAIGTYYGKARVAVNGTFKYIALYNS